MQPADSILLFSTQYGKTQIPSVSDNISKLKGLCWKILFLTILCLFQHQRPKSTYGKTAPIPENKNLILRQGRTKRMPFMIAEWSSVLKFFMVFSWKIKLFKSLQVGLFFCAFHAISLKNAITYRIYFIISSRSIFSQLTRQQKLCDITKLFLSFCPLFLSNYFYSRFVCMTTNSLDYLTVHHLIPP